jgi:hypothetical protein
MHKRCTLIADESQKNAVKKQLGADVRRMTSTGWSKFIQGLRNF